jgi:hypothetical protein
LRNTKTQFPPFQHELPVTSQRKDLYAGLGVVVFDGPQGHGFYKGGHNGTTANTMVCVEAHRRGNCYDNAALESFCSALKLDLVYRRSFETRAQAQIEIFDYIERFYNRQRSHSTLDYRSPVDFELQNN